MFVICIKYHSNRYQPAFVSNPTTSIVGKIRDEIAHLTQEGRWWRRRGRREKKSANANLDRGGGATIRLEHLSQDILQQEGTT